MIELKPCPFCGGTPVFHCSTGRVHKTGNIYSIYSVDCGECDLTGPRSETKKGAAIAWNSRASGWISVKDRLPEKTGRYIVHQWRTGETSDCDYYHRDDPYTTFPGWEYEKEKISHWMPLPSAPEVEE